MNVPFRALGLAALSLLMMQAQAQVHTLMQGRSFKYGSYTIMYRLFVPKNYDAKQKYPIMTAMHGVGEKGADNNIQVDREDLASTWMEDTLQARVPHFVMVPQCPSSTSWGGDAILGVHGIIDSLKREFSIDTNRLYVAGLSMGGRGTFNLLQARPGYFAAALPCAGAGDNSAAANIAKTPIWAFHSITDPVVDVAGTRTMVAAIEQSGTKFLRFTSTAAIKSPSLSAYRDALKNGTKAEDLVAKNLTPGYDSLKRAVATARYLYQEIAEGDHRTGWMVPFHHPLVTGWIYSKVRGGSSVALAPRTEARMTRNGATLLFGNVPQAPGAAIFSLDGRQAFRLTKAAAPMLSLPAGR